MPNANATDILAFLTKLMSIVENGEDVEFIKQISAMTNKFPKNAQRPPNLYSLLIKAIVSIVQDVWNEELSESKCRILTFMFGFITSILSKYYGE